MIEVKGVISSDGSLSIGVRKIFNAHTGCPPKKYKTCFSKKKSNRKGLFKFRIIIAQTAFINFSTFKPV